MKIKLNSKLIEAKRIFITAKCSDLFSAQLINDKEAIVAEYNGYVPEFFPEEHSGDYVELDIDLETGQIINWQKPTRDELQVLRTNPKATWTPTQDQGVTIGFIDGEIVGVDNDGCLILWDADRQEEYNCGESLEEFGRKNLTSKEQAVIDSHNQLLQNSTTTRKWNPKSQWEDHPKYPPEDWTYEVGNGDTRLGYVEWVNNKLDAEEESGFNQEESNE